MDHSIRLKTPEELAKQCPAADYMGEHACENRHQCWEPCGQLGHSAEHARVWNGERPRAT